ncbi:MAG: gamma-glutamyltransferase [Pseudomonadota bacterium]
MTQPRWQVASGHIETTRAAAEILCDGGNAFDALIAAAWTACVAEPIFCSPGGGAHALLRPVGQAPTILDGFTQTPQRKRNDKVDFYPIYGNFGTDTQEFHVGLGAAAVPGMVASTAAMQQRYASLPMRRLTEPAVRLARTGVVLNRTQSDALKILEPIVRSNSESARIFGLDSRKAALPECGDRITNADLGNFIDCIAAQGAESFYQGETAALIASLSDRLGGHIRQQDLSDYRVHIRQPMQWTLSTWRLWSNPPPAFGGLMVGLMTQSLERRLPRSATFGSDAHLDALLVAMRDSETDRKRLEQPECLRSDTLLMQTYNKLIERALIARKGTTHISIRDTAGNLAAMTLSNGEGCGVVVPGCGFMLNNMLGEADLNRLGFHHWPENRRMASMMAPTLLSQSSNGVEQTILLGSGGANRIRTAIAQVICNIQHFNMTLEQAIHAPRSHLEEGRLSIELDPDAWPQTTAEWLDQQVFDTIRWPQRSLYFGGVNAVSNDHAASDQRRDGFACSSA